MTQQSMEEKLEFIREAMIAFEEALNDANHNKHAVFLVFDDDSKKMQTYTFNADMQTLFLMVTSAYEMLQEVQTGQQLRTLN